MLMQRFLDSLTIHHHDSRRGWVVAELQSERGWLSASPSRERVYFYLDCPSMADASLPIPTEHMPIPEDVSPAELLHRITGLRWAERDWPTEVRLLDDTNADALLPWHERSYAAAYLCQRSPEMYGSDPAQGGCVLDLREMPDALARLARLARPSARR
jgi:hypothetical protein